MNARNYRWDARAAVRRGAGTAWGAGAHARGAREQEHRRRQGISYGARSTQARRRHLRQRWCVSRIPAIAPGRALVQASQAPSVERDLTKQSGNEQPCFIQLAAGFTCTASLPVWHGLTRCPWQRVLKCPLRLLRDVRHFVL